MSLKKFTVACDYPGCESVLETDYYSACLSDHGWACMDTLRGYFAGRHVCHKHTRDDLRAIDAVEARRQKYLELKEEFGEENLDRPGGESNPA